MFLIRGNRPSAGLCIYTRIAKAVGQNHQPNLDPFRIAQQVLAAFKLLRGVWIALILTALLCDHVVPVPAGYSQENRRRRYL